MTDCDSCGKVIRFLPTKRKKPTGFTVRANGKQDECNGHCSDGDCAKAVAHPSRRIMRGDKRNYA